MNPHLAWQVPFPSTARLEQTFFKKCAPSNRGLTQQSTCSPRYNSLAKFRAPSRNSAEKGSNLTMVFTGIVEEMGHVVSIENLTSVEGDVNLTVLAATTREGASLGDSISVNGTCLTVTALTKDSFTFGLAPETLRRTNLGDLRVKDNVNLERSMSPLSRFGGHIVQGHVDCAGTIVKVQPEKDAVWFTIEIEREFMKYIVEKGYVAVDGASLTVCEVGDRTFTFTMIPFTQQMLTTASKTVGDRVNIECDITGKYIERIMQFRSAGSDTSSRVYSASIM